jgi:hypothetical protein
MHSKTTTLAAASVAALLAGGTALAQIGQPVLVQPKTATIDNPLIVPKLEVVNGLNRAGGCERFGDVDVYRKGVDTFMEIVSGDTALIMIGPDIDRTTSIRYVRDNRTTVSGVIERRIAKGSVCGPNVAGMAAIVVRFNLPDIAAVERGTIEIFGKKERLLQVDASKLQPQLCDGGEIGMIPCPQTQPVVVAALDLKVVPRPVTSSINPAGPLTISGDRHVQVATLNGQRLALVKPVVGAGFRVPEGGHNDTHVPVLVDIFLSPNSSRRVEPKIGVDLRRGGQLRLVDLWDTANTTGDAASRRFNKLGYEVRRGAAEPPPPPPPPQPQPTANLDPFDPGNTLYKATGGTTTDAAGNIYTALSKQDFCQGIPLPGGSSSSPQANRREITVPNIRWGVRNRGNAAAPANAQLQLKFNGRVVATHTFAQPIAAGATAFAPDFVRPDSTNTVAVLTGGGACYHAGLDNEGWTDNGGYTIVLGTEVERID